MTMLQQVFDGLSGRAAKPARLGFALLVLAGLGMGPLFAQPASPASPPVQPSPALQARAAELDASIVELAGRLANEPRLRGLSPQKRQERVEFVVGNMIFVTAHELGHAVVSELDLPVLAREEDTADVYAILKALRVVGNEFAHRTLVRATNAWFLSARRDRRDGDTPTYYQRHGLDEQRAYHIVCLMFGSDPAKFKALADEHKLPEDRRRSCGWDYDTAARSWERVLAPHLRAPDQPKARIEVIYGDATGPLEVVARSFREIRFLEHFAEYAAGQYLWPAPIVMEMRSCGEPGARWTIPTRTMHICYEMVDEFVELFNEQERSLQTARRRTNRSPGRVAQETRARDRGTRAFTRTRPR
jgi:Putative metallopeptidase